MPQKKLILCAYCRKSVYSDGIFWFHSATDMPECENPSGTYAYPAASCKS